MNVFPFHVVSLGVEDGVAVQFLHTTDDFGNLVRVPAWQAVSIGASAYPEQWRG